MDKEHFFNFGWAWIAFTVALALHVTDEALTDFLSVYNPSVLSIRRHVPFLPLPTFTFRVWLSGLVLGIIRWWHFHPLRSERQGGLWLRHTLSESS